METLKEKSYNKSNFLTINHMVMTRKRFRYILTVLIFLASPLSHLYAQGTPNFGLKGGVNFSTYAQSDLDGYETKAGVVLGAFLEIGIPMSPVSIQPEVLYSQFGANFENIDAKLEANYIQIPVLLKISSGARGIPGTPKVIPNFHVGPYANFRLSSELDGDGGSVDTDEIMKDSSYGIILGGGLSVDRLQIGVGVSLGLTDVFEDNFTDGEKNLGIALTLGVTL